MVSVALFAMLIGCPRNVQAEPQTHDGLYLHLDFGAGAFYGWSKQQSSDVSYRGLGIPFTFAIGGTVASNLALFGALEINLGVTDEKSEWHSGGVDHRTAFVGEAALSMGIAYYFMPSNVVFTLSAGFPLRSIIIAKKVGVAARATLGKEWWVSDDWGVGLAGYAVYQLNPVDGFHWHTVSGGLLLSASYH